MLGDAGDRVVEAEGFELGGWYVSEVLILEGNAGIEVRVKTKLVAYQDSQTSLEFGEGALVIPRVWRGGREIMVDFFRNPILEFRVGDKE